MKKLTQTIPYNSRLFSADSSTEDFPTPYPALISTIENYMGYSPCVEKATEFLADERVVKRVINEVAPEEKDNYLYNQFIFFLSAYVRFEPAAIIAYLCGEYEINELSNDFARYCLANGIELDADVTLQSFSKHNKLSDDAVKNVLLSLPYKETYNLLGYGLDNGLYECSLANYLIASGKAAKVSLYGLDPYANKSDGIQYLDIDQVNALPIYFDLIVARWVLHHVASDHRWSDLVQCMNHSTIDAQTLIVEHGFINQKLPVEIQEKVYYIFNAFFDVVANIGLRPDYLKGSSCGVESGFFVDYLDNSDFLSISRKTNTELNIREVGPGFPNQTICTMIKQPI